ncbi:MAG: amino acid ABC transporter ATP-binding protein [Planctomycetia bacterium]|nr:amino acid ABC transporter ATP-binding protein [Planctomycetia bacterium]
MIGVEGLAKARGDVPVLVDVSLRAREGEVMAIVGPSGGGKSTLLRCLNGLEVFDAGAVEIAAHRMRPGPHPPRLLEAVRRDVGMVFQQFNLFPHLTVLENVSLGPRVVARLPVAEARARALAQLDRVGLAAFAASRPATLSGGQQQRVAIARALALAPRVMLFDEPTSALDPAMSAEVMETIVALARAGQTMVVVTHDHAFARRAATQVVELVAGRITRTGPPADILGP